MWIFSELFSLLFFYLAVIAIIYIRLRYIFWRSASVEETRFSGFDAGASVLKGRMELLL